MTVWMEVEHNTMSNSERYITYLENNLCEFIWAISWCHNRLMFNFHLESKNIGEGEETKKIEYF